MGNIFAMGANKCFLYKDVLIERRLIPSGFLIVCADRGEALNLRTNTPFIFLHQLGIHLYLLYSLLRKW